MSLSKKKMCDGCQKEQFIWKNHEGNKYCVGCWNKLKPQPVKPISKPIKVKDKKSKPINKVSTKRKEQNKEYSILRKQYLNEHPICEAGIRFICTYDAVDIHHLYSGSDRNKYFLDITTWKSVCRECHQYIHDVLTKNEAIELGLKLIE